MQWFENEDFWQTFYPYIFDEGRLAAASAEVDRILQLSGVDHGNVLDLCCGPARHSAELAQRGFSVTGVDRSPFLLVKARERLAGAAVELIEADMRDFIRPGAFDLVLNLFTSFGYLETREQDLAVLGNVRASLKPGGVFLIDVIGKETVAANKCLTRWEDLPGGDIWIHRAAVLPGWSRMHIEWLLVTGDRARRFAFEHNLYSGHELSDILKDAGFADVQLFGSLDGAPYNVLATRLIARAS